MSGDGVRVLALDAGSSSVRALLFGAAGEAAGTVARRRYRWRTAGGAMEVEAGRLLELCVEVLDEALALAREAGEAERIGAVALTGFWHGLLGVDAAGEPVTPVFGWADGRAREAAGRLRERIDPEAAHRRTGCFVHESYPSARLAWLREARGDTFRRVHLWTGFGEHLALRLFGVPRASVSMASGTGLRRLDRPAWDAEVLEAVGVDEGRLPEVSDEPLTGLRAPWAERWPELASVPWLPVRGDGACACVGAGAAAPGDVSLTVGTSAAVRALRDGGCEAPPGLWCYRLDARRTVAGRALSNGGAVFAWLAETLRLPPPEELEAALAAMRPDAHGLTVLPELLPERPPASGAGAGVTGTTSATTPERTVRAWLEAVALRIAEALAAVERGAGPARRIAADGGALRASPAWRQVVADALGRPLHLAAGVEAAMRGAALGALERLGVIADLAEAPPPPSETVEPDPAAGRRYAAAAERMRALEARLRGPAPDDTT